MRTQVFFLKVTLENTVIVQLIHSFSDEEEALQKVRAGFRADLGHPCSQSLKGGETQG